MNWRIRGARVIDPSTGFDQIADVLVREAQLPPLRVGDVIALGRCGAYSVTEGVSVFLSRDMPRVALYRDGAFTLVRDRFATDVLNTCQTLEDGK